MRSLAAHEVVRELANLDAKINNLLPARYQHCYQSVSPDSMGSAGLKYDSNGKVVWGEIWTTFCDLALAGGPPHRGTLLEPVSEAEVAARPEDYAEVVSEISRAIRLAAGIPVAAGDIPGWVDVKCGSPEEAAWLQFAVTAENVSARRRHRFLQLPAGPAFRVEKEIKNVVVALIKTSHYWDGHLTTSQQALAGEEVWEAATPAEAAASPAEHAAAVETLENELLAAGLQTSPRLYAGWVGVVTPDEEAAVWLLRAVLVERILARREGRVLFVPVNANPQTDQSARVGRAVRQAWELWTASTSNRSVWRGSSRPG